MADLVDIGWRYAVSLARKGDWSQVAKQVKAGDPIPQELHTLLRELAAGKLPPPNPKTHDWRLQKVMRPLRVHQMVELDMMEAGRQRDKEFRAKIVAKWCRALGVAQAEYESWLKLPKHRRLPKS